MNNIYLIDSYANSIDSFMHKSSYILKTLFAVISLLFIISSHDYLRIILFSIAVFLMMIFAKLPVKTIMVWSLYPLSFGLLFSLSQLFVSIETAILIMLRVFSSSILMLLIINTTPVTVLFSIIPSTFMRNFFLLTYRFFFMTVNSVLMTFSIMKIRGLNNATILRKISSISSIVGHGLIQSIEKGERVYNIMKTRGFNGKLGFFKQDHFSRNDILLIVAIIGVVILWL